MKNVILVIKCSCAFSLIFMFWIFVFCVYLGSSEARSLIVFHATAKHYYMTSVLLLFYGSTTALFWQFTISYGLLIGLVKFIV